MDVLSRKGAWDERMEISTGFLPQENRDFIKKIITNFSKNLFISGKLSKATAFMVTSKMIRTAHTFSF